MLRRKYVRQHLNLGWNLFLLRLLWCIRSYVTNFTWASQSCNEFPWQQQSFWNKLLDKKSGANSKKIQKKCKDIEQ